MPIAIIILKNKILTDNIFLSAKSQVFGKASQKIQNQ